MAKRIGNGGNRGILKGTIWKLPDSKPDPVDDYLVIRLPYPHMRLPSAEETLTITIPKKFPQWILNPRGGKRWAFDSSMIRPKPTPRVKAPPKGDGTARKGRHKSKKFMGIVRQRRPAGSLQRPHDDPSLHHQLLNATLGTNNLGAVLAAHVSAMTFVRR